MITMALCERWMFRKRESRRWGKRFFAIPAILINASSLVYFIYIVVAHGYVDGTEQITSLPGLILAYASLGWFLLEVVTMLTNSKRRAIHDLIAKTVVLRVA